MGLDRSEERESVVFWFSEIVCGLTKELFVRWSKANPNGVD